MATTVNNRIFGFSKFHAINRRLSEMLSACKRPVAIVHRGTGHGVIPENTIDSATAAFKMGADIIELDVIRSTDGDFFLFHDGYEQPHFGITENIRTLSTAKIQTLSYKWMTSEGNLVPRRVETLAAFLTQFQDRLLNVDRSWFFWDTLLDDLNQFGSLDGMILKAPAQSDALGLLAKHHRKFPFTPMVRSHEDVLHVLAIDDINTIGFELLPDGPNHDFARPDYIEWLHSIDMFAIANAINLSDGKPLFLGFDDNTSVLVNPAQGWGRLFELGVDFIQTDWPSLYVSYRNTLRG